MVIDGHQVLSFIHSNVFKGMCLDTQLRKPVTFALFLLAWKALDFPCIKWGTFQASFQKKLQLTLGPGLCLIQAMFQQMGA